MNTSFYKGIMSGTAAGVVWGWVSMVVNSISGAFPFEHSFIFNVIIFSISGAVFGVIVAGSLVLFGEHLPFLSKGSCRRLSWYPPLFGWFYGQEEWCCQS